MVFKKVLICADSEAWQFADAIADEYEANPEQWEVYDGGFEPDEAPNLVLARHLHLNDDGTLDQASIDKINKLGIKGLMHEKLT